jgi:hypothetical protein
MGEMKQENHIPKSYAHNSQTHPQPHLAATVGSRDEGEDRSNHAGEAAPGLLALWRPAAAGRREPRPCSRRRARRRRTEERIPRPRPLPLLPCLHVVGQRGHNLTARRGTRRRGRTTRGGKGQEGGTQRRRRRCLFPFLRARWQVRSSRSRRLLSWEAASNSRSGGLMAASDALGGGSAW